MENPRTVSEVEHAKAVRAMFSDIAPRYDLLNHVLSANIDKRWRRLVRDSLSKILANENAAILDVACGTGDLSIELRSHSKARVTGTDFCRPMLELAAQKTEDVSLDIPYIEADAMSLPFADGRFDAVTIAFGLRNLSNFSEGLNELFRVLKPGGKLVVLDFSKPRVPGFAALFNFYFTRVLPRLGGAVSGSRGAYQYLPDSVSKFPDQEGLAKLMETAGFSSVTFQDLTGGIAAIHSGVRAG